MVVVKTPQKGSTKMGSLGSDFQKRFFGFGLLLGCGFYSFPAAAGSYTQLHAFTGKADGALPYAGLTADSSRNLYGTASAGGSVCSADPLYGCGVIFKIDEAGNFSVIYDFTGAADGFSPQAGLALARATLFSGSLGGANGAGLLFSIKPDGTQFTVIHQFTGIDGSSLRGLMQPVSNGDLFGVTEFGGPEYTEPETGNGVLFRIGTNGAYAVVHRFAGDSDGRRPTALLADTAGNLFGSTNAGGAACKVGQGCGVIFEYAPSTETYTVLYAFQGSDDGGNPILGSIGPDGTLYGAAQNDGQHKHGTLFALTPIHGVYTFSTLLAFQSSESGDGPAAGPTLTRDGALVGATYTYIYGYKNGKASSLLTFSDNVPISYPNQLLVEDAVAYGTSSFTDNSTCTFSSGQQYGNGCGSVFAYIASPASN
jgi:uncharacterized repeat protein (TIGR03803 family)